MKLFEKPASGAHTFARILGVALILFGLFNAALNILFKLKAKEAVGTIVRVEKKRESNKSARIVDWPVFSFSTEQGRVLEVSSRSGDTGQSYTNGQTVR